MKVLKCYYSQRTSLGADRENIVLRNLCFMIANVRHLQKSISSIDKYFS